MKTSKTDAAIEKIRNSGIPPCPGSMEDNVWRKIRQRREEEASVPWWAWVDELLAQKRFLAATLALAFMVSLSTLLLSRTPSDPPPQVSVSSYLDFDSFTHPPANLFDHS